MTFSARFQVLPLAACLSCALGGCGSVKSKQAAPVPDASVSDAGGSGGALGGGGATAAGAPNDSAGAAGEAGQPNENDAGTLPPAPPPPQTHFLDANTLLTNVEDKAWFLENVPLFEAPDDALQSVYYYRWQSYKEHLVYTGPIYGYLSNEFLEPVSYGAPYGGVVAAAGHQISEGRWLQNQQYVKDDINYWLNGPGQFSKPPDEAVNASAADWAHEYSFWAASSVWQQYLASGDRAFVTALQPALIRQYEGWANHFDAALGLYWQVPVWDATELSASSYESSDPYHGGAGFRPSINAYQYGDARAIAQIAVLMGDGATADRFNTLASALQMNQQKYLWDATRNFFYDMPQAGNAAHTLLGTREEMGFIPWMFDMPRAADATQFASLLDAQGFAAKYGPTTIERRSPWFMHEAANCCRWDGPSWPYETAQTLTALANLLDDYPTQSVISADDYLSLLHGYALTQYKTGKPYVAEAHDPDADQWLYDSTGHSEDYNHSTFADNVLAGLVGLRGQADNTLLVKPLAPATWAYFAAENVPYHGHQVTVLWDRVGSRYLQGPGLRVFVDGVQRVVQGDLQPVTVNVGAPTTQSSRLTGIDVAANGQHFANGPEPFASYTFATDDVWHGVDGLLFRVGIPENTRWTSYKSKNVSDYYGVNFKHDVSVDYLKLSFYDDGGGVRTPHEFDVQYLLNGVWLSVPAQTHTPGQPSANGATEIRFPTITTSQLRVLAPNPSVDVGWGLSEFWACSQPIFQISNLNSGLFLTVDRAPPSAAAQAQQANASASASQRWELLATGSGDFELLSLNSGLVLGVADASTKDSALVQQAPDSNVAAQHWSLIDTGKGQFQIKNAHSGLLLGVDQASTADSANVVQFHDNGTPDQLWTLQPAAALTLATLDSATADDTKLSLLGEATWRGYTVAAQLSFGNAMKASAGIALRVQDATHYYLAEITRAANGAQRWDISKNDGGTWSELASGNYAPDASTSALELRASAQGGTLTFAVVRPSGAIQTLGSVFDTSFPSGKAGLSAQGAPATFTAVRVTAG